MTFTDHPPIAAPLPDVVTDRLVLRRPEPSDVDDLARVFAQAEVWRFPYGRGMSREETEQFVAKQCQVWDETGFGLWLAELREGRRLVGYLGLAVPTFLPDILPAVEVGWRLEPAVWGQGLATEGARAALDEAFGTLRLPEVCSIPQVGNDPSHRVAARLGLRPGPVRTLPATDRRGAVDAVVYWIRQDEWLDQR